MDDLLVERVTTQSGSVYYIDHWGRRVRQVFAGGLRVSHEWTDFVDVSPIEHGAPFMLYFENGVRLCSSYVTTCGRLV